MRSIDFYIVDVFAEAKYQGNQLAVFYPADGLSSEEMLQITREINFAESTFILSDQASEKGYPVRIFTPGFEVPFAGHPTLGTAYVISHFLNQNSPQERPLIRLDLPVGTVPVQAEADTKGLNWWMTQNKPEFYEIFSPEEIAAILQIPPGVLDDSFPIQLVSTGLPFVVVPVKTKSALNACNLHPELYFKFVDKYKSVLPKTQGHTFDAFLIFCPETDEPENDLQARMLYHELVFREDSATGSANGCLLAYLLKHRYYPEASIQIRVEQGVFMGRPSLIFHAGERIHEDEFIIRIGGKVQTVAQGTWQV